MSQEQKPVVLLIDDSPSIHRLLAYKLKNEGLEFLAAFTGGEGLELALAHAPSLILLDLTLPDLHGLEVLRQLKDNPKSLAIPVIIISANDTSQDKVAAFEIGAMDFVCKPVDVPELRARMQSAIRFTRMMRTLEQRACIDALTELGNRARFDQIIKSELHEAERSKFPLSLAMCDIDRFKHLNDTFGHPAGDDVLRIFAGIITRSIRVYDEACRFGGEEFALIFPNTRIDEAVGICERIRKSLEAYAWSRYPDIRCTVSFGVTDHGLNGVREPYAWIEAADRALYAAKNAGRNAVVVFDESSTDGLRRVS